MIRPLVDRFQLFLNEPIRFGARIVLALLVLPLALSFTQPLWRITLHAPQYPSGLYVDISSYRIDGGHGGHDLDEINELNHYIGMRRLERAAFEDLDWLPFAIGLLAILVLRTALIGNVRTLVDLTVITGYISAFAFGRFVYKLYVFGHDLDPHAALKIQPFMPAVFGTKQIANFSTEALPRWGSLYMGVFVAGVALVTVWHLVAGYRAAWRKPAVAAALAMVVSACAVSTAAPAPLDAARTSCGYCRMGVTDPRTASQIVTDGEDAAFFDDLSCLAGYLREHGAPGHSLSGVYVADHRTAEWVPAARATFVRVSTLTGAMGSHVLAYASSESRDGDPAARGGIQISQEEALGGGAGA
jgi:nitrous oxide reductase accessory protein NosL